MNSLYITIGAPGSGKSTYLDKAKVVKQNSIIISRDDIRFSFLKSGDSYFKYEDLVFEKYTHDIHDALDKYQNVFADATHLNEKSRNKLLNNLNLNLNDIYIVALNFRTSLKTCIERNRKRQGLKFVPEAALVRMYNSLEFVEVIDDVYNKVVNIMEV